MSQAPIQFEPRLIKDSRGRPTVAVAARQGHLQAEGDVPAGASKGKDEARTVAPEAALGHITGTLAQLVAREAPALGDARALRNFDATLARAAGDNFATLGANATLPVSRALWRLGAQKRGIPLWQFLREGLTHAPNTTRPVRMFMNIFNGGLHAIRAGEELGRERIDLQEVMVVPFATNSYREALAMGDAIDEALAHLLEREFGRDKVGRADEAGFSVRGLGDSHRAIALVKAAIEAAGLVPGRDVKVALDCAAQSFVAEDEPQAHGSGAIHYRLGGKLLHSEEMVAWHEQLVARYPSMLLSIEDGLGEDDWAAWSKLTASMQAKGVVTIGDDLFVTQLPRLRRGIAERAASAILIKVNQNGTVGGTLAVIDEAHEAQLECVVSHRSGETLDDSIADLAVACGALGLKSGDPQPPRAFPDPASWHRRVKYARLVEIERQGNKM